MKKLKLNLDALQVDSFGTADAAAAGRGTVHGQAATLTKPTCVSCGGHTDPCLCDPFHPDSEFEVC